MSEEIKFEKAMERLSKIVEDLESGNISLDEALKKYEEGVKLSRSCHEQLSRAEKKIETLTKNAEGSLVKQPFEYQETEETPPKKNHKKSQSPKPASDAAGADENEEDLLF